MNRSLSIVRFSELDAGRVLGDLDAAESAEWEALAAQLGQTGDPALDRFAAVLEVEMIGENPSAVPESLSARLLGNLPHRKASAPAEETPDPLSRNSIVIGPWLGWAVAACLLGWIGVSKLLENPEPDTGNKRMALLENAADLRRLPLAGAGPPYAATKGEVVWSDSKQEGYMTLTNLPVNEPSKNQYQLWIVDPARDEFPVDGGVFDILPGSGSVVIAIDAKLAVKNPAAFVITLERPGGVVRSKQEIVVALAKS